MEFIFFNMFVFIINVVFEDREVYFNFVEIDLEFIEFIMKWLKVILGVNLFFLSVGFEQKWFVDDLSDDENGYRIISIKNCYNVLNRKLVIL